MLLYLLDLGSCFLLTVKEFLFIVKGLLSKIHLNKCAIRRKTTNCGRLQIVETIWSSIWSEFKCVLHSLLKLSPRCYAVRWEAAFNSWCFSMILSCQGVNVCCQGIFAWCQGLKVYLYAVNVAKSFVFSQVASC